MRRLIMKLIKVLSNENINFFTKQTFYLSLEKAFFPLMLIFSVLALSQSAIAQDEELIAHWPLLEGTGSTASDTTGNGHDGTLVNNPTWNNDGLVFDGLDDYINIGTLNVPGQALTLAAWIQADQLENCIHRDCRILSKATGTAEQAHYWMLSTIKVGNQTRLRFRLKTNGITSALVASTGNLINGDLFHVAAVYDGATMRLYKDGAEVGSLAKTGSINTNNSVQTWIGSNPNNANSRPWKGLIADVRIYQQALTEADVNDVIDKYQADDTLSPIISNIQTTVTDTSTTISWQTNELSDSTVAYGLSSDLEIDTLTQNGLKTSHSVTLSGLIAETSYHYQIQVTDSSTNSTLSDNLTFTTARSTSTNSDLIAHWPLNEGTGTTAKDITGNDYDGILTNAPKWINSQLMFDGNNDYVDVGTLDVSGQALTLAAWVQVDKLENCIHRDCRILSKATGTAEQAHYWMLSTVKVGNQTRLRFRLKTNGTTSTLVASTGNLTNGEMFHVAAIYDGATMRLYKNGIEVGNKVKIGNIDTNTTVKAWIGNNPNNANSRPWKGTISDVRIYQQALTINQVNDVKNDNQVDDTTPPIISNIQPTITHTTATISWQTNEKSDSTVAYGLNLDSIGSEISDTSQTTTHSIGLVGLVANTQYYFQISSTDSNNNTTVSDPILTFTTASTPDTLAPNISNINTVVTDTTASISWETDEAANSAVTYGKVGINIDASESNGDYTITHRIHLTGLTADTEYYFSVSSTDANGLNDSSAGMFFTTHKAGNLIAHWPLNEGDGLTANDITGNGQNGALINDPNWINNELHFDGENDYIDLGPFDVPGEALALTSWVQADQLENCEKHRDCRILSKATGTAEQSHFWMLSTIKVGNQTRLRFRLKTNGITTTLVASSGNLSNGERFHVAAVYDGTTMYLYKNGIEVGSREKTGIVDANNTVKAWIGGNPNNANSRPWKGTIADVRIYQQALTIDQVNNVKDDSQASDITPPTISNIQAIVTDTTATISWQTNELSDSAVAYRLDQASIAITINDVSQTVTHSILLDSLDAGTQYYYQIRSTDGSNNTTFNDPVLTFTTAATLDATAPIISNINTVVTETTATISWETDELSNSSVAYGLNSSYGGTKTDDSISTTHELSLTGLIPGAIHHFQISSADSSGNFGPSEDQTFTTIAISNATIQPKDVARFLTQSTFGPNASAIQHLVELGSYENWLDEQFNLPPSYHRPLIKTSTNSGPSGRMNVWWDVAVFNDDQLRQRVAFAFSEIMVVSDLHQALLNPRDTVAEYYDILVRHSFGNFRDLLEDITLSPAMGIYLSMLGNDKPDPTTSRRADENYAREILQLFSIGLVELNNNGTPKLDSSGKPIDTYTESDVENLARIFTGWAWNAGGYTRDDRAGHSRPELTIKPMVAFPNFHDQNEKNFLGISFSAGQTASDDLDQALDIIFHHANVGPFISKQLIMRLVTSNPSPDYVSRVTQVFNNNGVGIRGDLRAVVKAILLDPEARTSTSNHFGKLKEPLIRLTHLWRAFNASTRSMNGYDAFHYNKPEQQLSQAPMRAPSVFNFFRPDFSPHGEIKSLGLVAPEFLIVSESRLQKADDAYINFAVNGSFDESDPIILDLADELALVEEPEKLIGHLDLLLTTGSMSSELRQILLSYFNSNRLENNGDEQLIRNLIALIISSAEYSIQR